jgi:prepilin-type N-terminal cleavage/methylation domain-containing protein
MILSSLGHRKGHVRGFTLIELLVVIAIIGILSSVVLASLNTARNKGADASIKSNIDSTRAQSELYYDSGSTYAGLCAAAATATPPGIAGMLTAAAASVSGTATVDTAIANAAAANKVTCHDSATAWAAAAPTKTAAGYWCVDSTGFSGQKTVGIAANATVCS